MLHHSLFVAKRFHFRRLVEFVLGSGPFFVVEMVVAVCVDDVMRMVCLGTLVDCHPLIH